MQAMPEKMICKLESPARRLVARTAFTLTEMLVVIGLIILLLSMALPAFNFMSGSTSIEGAANTVSAVLARVRQDAIGIQKERGVVFYFDKQQERLVAAFVEFKDLTNAWVGAGPNIPTYQVGDYVYTGVSPTQTFWVCIEPNQSVTPSTATIQGQECWRLIKTPGGNLNNAQSVALNTYYPVIDAISTVDLVSLPKVLDVRGVCGQGPTNTAGNEAITNTTNPAVYIFDGSGQLVNRRYCLLSEGIIGKAGEFPRVGSVGSKNIGGVAVVDQTMNMSQTVMTMFKAEDAANNSNETADPDGKWFAENGRPFLINRYNGTLMKGE